MAAVAAVAFGWHWLESKRPQFTQYLGHEEVDPGYYPGGQSCNPFVIGPFPHGEPLSDTDACREAREEYRLKATDLVQQIRAADAAQTSARFAYPQTLFMLLGLGFGLLTLGAAVAAAIYARQAANETKRANAIAKAVADIDQRPWISLDLQKGKKKASRGNLPPDRVARVSIPLEVRAKNYGKTPAAYYAEAVHFDMTTTAGQERSRAQIAEIKARFRREDAFAVIFPGEDIPVEFAGRAGADPHLIGWEDKPEKMMNVDGTKVYCIVYAAVSGGETYETSRMVSWTVRVPVEQWQSPEAFEADFTFNRISFGDVTT